MKLNIQMFADEVSMKMTFDNSVKGQKKLERYAETLEKINGIAGAIQKGGLNDVNKYSKEISKIKDNTKQAQKDTSDLGNTIKKAFSTLSIAGFLKGIKSISSSFTKLSKQSVDYLENFNLFQVAFNGNYRSAERFINKMSEMYGLDESWLTETVGKFKQLTNAMHLSEEEGEKVAKLLTQMSLDISSLYNVDIDRASSTLQSALAGQTKPIRGTTGADITESTLQVTVDNIGLDKTVKQLSYAEKRLVTIISLTDQLKASTGDMARTIESPSNQLRIMNEQWARLSRAVGNVFLPILSKVLPYLNAILMVITEIISVIASLVGYKQDDFDYFEKPSEDAYDLSDGLDEAGKSAKKLKQGLRGFDKLNVITTPSSSGSSAGGGAGGIDPKLQDAFNKAYQKYQDMLSNTEMKASKIRDRIMEWLGFTKQIDSETGKVSFKFSKITGGTILGALAVGGPIFIGIKKIAGFVSTISKLTGGGGGKGLLALFGGSAGTILAIAGAIAILTYAIYDLYQNNEAFAESFDEKWEGIKEAFAPVVEELQVLFDTIVTSFTEVLVPMFEQAWEIIQTTASVLLDILYPVFKDVLIPVLELVIKIFTDVFKTFNDLWEKYGKPISDAIKKAIERIGEIFEKLWVQVLEPITTLLMERLNDLWDTTIGPMFKKIGEVIGELIELILALWNNVIAPVIKYLIDTVGPKVEYVINVIINLAHSLLKTIGGVINGLLDVLKGIISFLTGIFTGDWKKALNGLVDILKGIVNIIASIVEGLINGVIDMLNSAIKFIFNGVKSLVNKVLSSVETIADFLGFDVDLTIKGTAPQIQKVTLPRLKTGIDFVPNDFFPAYLDYGERVLTKEENRDYNATMNDSTKSAKLTSFNPTFIIQVGDKEIAKQVLNNLEDMAKTDGTPIVIGG